MIIPVRSWDGEGEDTSELDKQMGNTRIPQAGKAPVVLEVELLPPADNPGSIPTSIPTEPSTHSTHFSQGDA